MSSLLVVRALGRALQCLESAPADLFPHAKIQEAVQSLQAAVKQEKERRSYLLAYYTPDRVDEDGPYLMILPPGQNPEAYCDPGWCVTLVLELEGDGLAMLPIDQKLTVARWEGSYWPMCREACRSDRLP